MVAPQLYRREAYSKAERDLKFCSYDRCVTNIPRDNK